MRSKARTLIGWDDFNAEVRCATVPVSPPLPRCRVSENRGRNPGALPVLDRGELRAMETAGSGRWTTRIAPIRIGAPSAWSSPRPHRIGRGGARYPRWRRNAQADDFLGKGNWVVNRAYPERNPAVSAPDRNKNPGFRRQSGMDYQISILKVLSQNDRKPVAQTTSWRSYLT